MLGPSRPATWVVLAVAGATAAVAALTAVAFLIRAGDPGLANWPVTWELRSSDNGVLFQFVRDLLTGERLEWTFSPQVYVFPELPISLLAYLVAAGNLYLYYLVVAMIANALLFLALLLVVRLARPDDGWPGSLARAALATSPLVVLPLVGTSWLVSLHLAPTYYLGMYLLVLAAPALLLVRTWPARAALGVAIALTAASNPLSVVFAGPAFAVALVLVGIRRGARPVLRAAGLVGVVLAIALLVRLTLFAPLQGASPLRYVDPDVFADRLAALRPYFDYLATDPSMRVILALGAALAIACLAGSVVSAVRYLLGPRGAESDGTLAGVYLGLVPLLGLAATLALMITHYLYFWLVLIAPFAIALLAVPRVWTGRLLPVAGGGFLVIALATGAVGNLAHPDRYFGHRNAETRCLDASLPEGAVLGYATFSDARRIGLASVRGWRLIQIRPDGSLHDWLTNLAPRKDRVGTFFYLNAHGDEPAIDRSALEARFGAPDDEFSCGDGQTVILYEDPAKLARIASYFQEVAVDPARE